MSKLKTLALGVPASASKGTVKKLFFKDVGFNFHHPGQANSEWHFHRINETILLSKHF